MGRGTLQREAYINAASGCDSKDTTVIIVLIVKCKVKFSKFICSKFPPKLVNFTREVVSCSGDAFVKIRKNDFSHKYARFLGRIYAALKGPEKRLKELKRIAKPRRLLAGVASVNPASGKQAVHL